MGFIKAIGCLVVIVAIAAVAYLSRGLWWGRVTGRNPVDSVSVAALTWQPLTTEGSVRARQALQRLAARTGPQYVDVAPGDLAAYIFRELSRTLPSSADSIQAAAIGERLHVRALILTSDLGAKDALGPISMLLGTQERVQMGGTIRIIRPGFAEFQVKEFRIRDFALPQALIPRLIRQITRGARPPGLAPDGLPLRTPVYIGDVRVSNGKITLYKAVSTPSLSAPNAAKSPDR